MGRGLKAYRNWTFKGLIGEKGGEDKMRQVGNRLAILVSNRTISGRDENNRAFAPYAHGGTKFGSGTVDLHLTGRMLEDLGPTEVTRTSVKVSFRTARSQEIAGYHMTGTTKMPKRAFLGMNREWLKEIKALIFGTGR